MLVMSTSSSPYMQLVSSKLDSEQEERYEVYQYIIDDLFVLERYEHFLLSKMCDYWLALMLALRCSDWKLIFRCHETIHIYSGISLAIIWCIPCYVLLLRIWNITATRKKANMERCFGEMYGSFSIYFLFQLQGYSSVCCCAEVAPGFDPT